MSYAAAGVDLGAAEENVRRIGQHVRSTHGPHVLGDFGAFAGLFHLKDVRDPVLVASTDGVGTKVLLGIEHGQHDVLGRDLVNLSVNDLITTGARPLFFLDYVGVHAIDHMVMEALVGGMASACRANGCALLGGETAQLADLYAPGHYDLAGTIVGVVERTNIIDGTTVRAGDRVWGLPSLGLHTNGFSLARQIVGGLDLDSDPGGLLGQSIAEALLQPHPSYLAALRNAPAKAIAHITGGGLPGNVPRVLPADVSVELDWGAWPVPPIFHVLQEIGGVANDEMARVFNMGVGMVVVTAPDSELDAIEIGRVVPRQSERVIIRRR